MDRREMLGVLGAAGLAATGASAYAQAGRQAGSESPAAGGHAKHASAEMVKEMRSMNEMMVKHLGERDEEYDLRFIDMMIPHHEGAVLMAKHALEHSDRAELKEMAKKMIKEQEKEIEQLKKWRKEWYGK